MRMLETARAALLTLPAVALMAFGSSPAWSHEGGLGNAVMWQACASSKINDPCSFQNVDHDTYRGTCQSMADHMVCVRNQPIERGSNLEFAHVHAGQPQPGAGSSAKGWKFGAFALLVGGLSLFLLFRGRGRREKGAI